MGFQSHLSRRKLLRYAGLSCLSLPLYRALLESDALGATPPPCALFFYYPDGNIAKQFFPSEIGSNFTLPLISNPLAPYASDIIIPRGLVYPTTGSHEGGAAYCLTGRSALPKPKDDNPVDYPGAYSIDTFLGSKIGNNKVLRLGVQTDFEGGPDKMVSYLDNGKLATLQSNPQIAFNEIFAAGISPNAVDIEAINAGKRSVLDFALGELQGLKAKLGATEASKLDLHVEALRSLEMSVKAVCKVAPTDLHGVVFPADPKTSSGYPSWFQKNEAFAPIGMLMTDIMVYAMACGSTRVGLLQWSHPVSPTSLKGINGITLDKHQHDLSHFGTPDSAEGLDFAKSQQFFMQMLAYLIKQMKAVQVGSGSLFDSSVILATTEIGDSNVHNFQDIACVVAGSANGKLKTGQSLQLSGNRSYNQLLITILRAMGLQDRQIGMADQADDPIAAMLT